MSIINQDFEGAIDPEQNLSIQDIAKELREVTRQIFDKRNHIAAYGATILGVLLVISSYFNWWYIAGGFAVCFVLFAVYSNKSLKNVQKDATLKLKQKYGTVPVNALFGQTLMEEVCWNFRIGQFDDQKLFYQALKMYNEEVQKKPFTYPLTERLNGVGKKVWIEFLCYDETKDAPDNYVITLDPNDSIGFTPLDLLFSINDILYHALEHDNHTFFEGLQWDGQNGDNTFFFLNLGS